VRAEDAYRLPRLHQQGFVLFKIPQRSKNGIKCLPGAGSLPATAVDHQAIRVFGNRWIKIVLDHAISCFDQPVFAGELGARWGVNFSRTGHW